MSRGTTVVARLSTSESTAYRLTGLLAERLDPRDVVATTSERTAGVWTVAVYFHSIPDQTALRQLVASVAGKKAGETITFDTLAEKDWVAASLEGFPPVTAGRFVVHGRHDRARVRVNNTAIEIEAALAFGTGHHGTTRGCLLALDRLLKARRPRRVLDVGTGSGVLVIAAAKACRRAALAGDIDPRAVTVARGNARTNGVAAFVAVIRAAGLRDRRFHAGRRYDLVFANILLQPLKALALPLARLAARDARIVLSGLLPSQAAAALAAYRTQGLALERRILLDGWTTLVLARAARVPVAAGRDVHRSTGKSDGTGVIAAGPARP
jgi:ribosomal protein L11 methyltransferase